MAWHDISGRSERELVVGFYDLTGYRILSRALDPTQLLTLMTDYFRLTGAIVEAAGGLLVKTIGDAGMVAFAAEDAVRAVDAMRRVKADGDAWLAARGHENRINVKLNIGRVACGTVAGRFDVYGTTVNDAADLTRAGVVLSEALKSRVGG